MSKKLMVPNELWCGFLESVAKINGLEVDDLSKEESGLIGFCMFAQEEMPPTLASNVPMDIVTHMMVFHLKAYAAGQFESREEPARSLS